MTVHVNHGDQTWAFERDAGVSLLDHLLAQRIPISHACRRGDCGQCAVELVAGEVAPIEAGRPLWLADTLLSCNATLTSAAQIRIPYDVELTGIVPQRSPAKIHALERLADEVMEMTLRLPPSIAFRFLPGQFIRLTQRDGITRSYSLAAGPAPDRLLRVHIRRVEAGAFSQWLFEKASIGDLLQVEGPQGRFFLRQDLAVARSLFLATGTGMAPIWAMLATMSPEQHQRLGEVCVYWGNRAKPEAYLAASLQQLALQKGFRLTLVFSRENSSASHRHVQDQMLADHPHLADAQLYACGNAAMIASARQRALEAGLPPVRFHSDAFTVS